VSHCSAVSEEKTYSTHSLLNNGSLGVKQHILLIHCWTMTHLTLNNIFYSCHCSAVSEYNMLLNVKWTIVQQWVSRICCLTPCEPLFSSESRIWCLTSSEPLFSSESSICSLTSSETLFSLLNNCSLGVKQHILLTHCWTMAHLTLNNIFYSLTVEQWQPLFSSEWVEYVV
jgi:hypothetical protein